MRAKGCAILIAMMIVGLLGLVAVFESDSSQYSTDFAVKFLGAELSVADVKRIDAWDGERGDYLWIEFHINNSEGNRQIVFDEDEATSVHVQLLNDASTSEAAFSEDDLDKAFTLSESIKYEQDERDSRMKLKIGEEGNFVSVYDLNPGSIKDNPEIKTADDLALIGNEIADSFWTGEGAKFRELLSAFWSGELFQSEAVQE